jgi:branched-chain amino acid transport system substrate-binding protein
MSHRTTFRGRRVFIGFSLSLSLIAASACSSDNESSSSSPTSAPSSESSTQSTNTPRPVALTIGLLTPPPGLLTDVGTATARGVQAAVTDINSGGGIGGEDVKVVTVDQALGSKASDSLPDLVSEGANSFIGPVGSTDALDVIPALAGSNLVACSGSATAPTLTTVDSENVFFRTAMPDQYLVDRLINEIDNRLTPDQTVTIVTRDDDYGNAIGLGLSDGLTALDRPVSVFRYPAAATSFGDLPQRVAATNPSLLILVTLTESPLLLSSLVNAGVSPDKMLGLDGMFDPRLASRTFPDDPSKLDGLSIIATTGGRDLFSRLIDEDPEAPLFYVSQAYDCAVSLALAGVVAGSADTAALAEALGSVTGGGVKCTTFADCLTKYEAGEDIDYDGPSGPIAFDEFGDPSGGRFTLAVISAGALTESKTEDVNLTVNALIDAHNTAISSAVVTASVQQDLTLLGYYDGPIDGVWDDDVSAALMAFQTDEGLPATGELDEATADALTTRVGAGKSTLASSTMTLQLQLTQLGFYSGPIDGRYTQEVVDAVKALQRSVGAPETGVLDIDTMRAIYAKGQQSVPPSTNPPTTEPAPTTAAPTTEAPTTTEAPAPETVLSTLEKDPQFSTVVGLIFIAGLNDELSATTASTFFAPNNDAFHDPAVQALLVGWIDDPATLAPVLNHLLVTGEAIPSANLVAAGDLTTAAGDTLTITDAEVPHITAPDIAAGASVIHGTDIVLGITAP